jgi:hypothetical protein
MHAPQFADLSVVVRIKWGGVFAVAGTLREGRLVQQA